MQHVIGQSMAWLIMHGDSAATAEHSKLFHALLEQRGNGQPIAYLTGHKEFWTLDLKVSPEVLIPRADTETLVQAALDLLQDKIDPELLDLGTGSGAIALSLAKEKPQSSVSAVDASQGALQIAQHNAQINNIGNVRFLQGDWFSGLGDQRFDLIASNPPYVAKGDPHLSQGDLVFEPDMALSSEDNGLADLKQIIQAAPKFLKATGFLIVEHGYQQQEWVKEIFNAAGFVDIRGYKDIQDLPRCTSGVLNV